MYQFQISLHPRSPAVTAGDELLRAGRRYPALRVPGEALGATFVRSFEEVETALAALERMYVEPDGSFVWVSADATRPWQVDGVLYDRDARLLFVELKGRCPADAFDQLLTACGWPATAVMMQLTQEGVFVDEQSFRALAEAEAD